LTGSAHESAIAFDQVGLTTSDGRVILDHIDLEVPSGSTTALLGRSGSGKTTLLRMVNRLIEPTSGRVMVGAKATADWDPIQLRRSIGYVIQETGLFPHFDAERNIGAVLEIEGRPKQEIAERARQLFTQVGLEPAACPTSFPGDNANVLAWRVRLPPSPSCC
jgi:osmoprotectant transport system ATP-binding protein